MGGGLIIFLTVMRLLHYCVIQLHIESRIIECIDKGPIGLID
jgi:hypothetical protein